MELVNKYYSHRKSLFDPFPTLGDVEKGCSYTLFTLRLFKNRTVIAGCLLGFFYSMAYYLSLQPYFYSYLMVARNTGSVAAGHITLTFSFVATVSSIVISLVIKYTKHYKYYMVGGILIYMLGIGIMLRYRNIDSSNTQVVACKISNNSSAES
ncbi:hypothetical protein B9Z19DRAFT_750906 [Tuber borchii]|uniref:Major facilitator superfamily (MFS) profile domain-containing protein n=1 Tax=Tuber borchii TaxID=42251 RepID=A0A2T7A7N4_TUBBO|nr:hypothetical protein B9Z19DRAFT_750906 [Tuber borchii]